MPALSRLFAPALLFALTACDQSPAARCAGPETRELRTIEDLITETQSRIDRGYVMERQDSGANVNLCLGGVQSHVGVSFCTDPGTVRRPVAIDQEAERRKLDALIARRDALRARIAALSAACART